MKRPKSFTILSLVLIWLSFASFMSIFITQGGGILDLIGNGLYCVTALIAAIGLWKTSKWSVNALIAWTIAVLINAIIFQFTFVDAPWLVFSIFIVLVIVVLTLIIRHVSKKLKTT